MKWLFQIEYMVLSAITAFFTSFTTPTPADSIKPKIDISKISLTPLTANTQLNWKIANFDVGGKSLLDVVAGGDGQFIVSGSMGELYSSSDGGISWRKEYSKLNGTISKIIYINGEYIAVSSPSGVYSSSSRIIKSRDGKNWEVVMGDYINQINGLFGIISSGDTYVAVGYDYGGILTSNDTLTWTNHRSGLPNNAFIMSVTWSPQHHLFVAVADAGGITTSPDGISWTPVPPVTSNDLYAVTYSTEKQQFIVVGTHGTILSSSDGKTWQIQASGTDQSLAEVIWSSSLKRYYAVGNQGTIISSPNGTIWIKEKNTGTTENLSGIAAAGNRIVAVGNKIVLTAN